MKRAALLLIVWIAGQASFAQDSELVLAAYENGNAIRRWDYLCVVEVVDDVKNHGGMIQTMRFRHIADLDAGKQVVVFESKQENIGVSSTAKDTQKVLAGAFSAGGKTKMYVFPNNITNPDGQEILSIAGELQVPDFRLIGLDEFPNVFSESKNSSSFELKFKTVRSRIARSRITSKSEGSQTRVITSSKLINKEDPKAEAVKTQLFDNRLLVPLSYNASVFVHGQWHPDTSQVCVWEEKNGSVVPLFVSADTNTGIFLNGDRSRQPVSYVRKIYANYHWFSVNEDVDSAFEKVSIADDNWLLDSISEEKTGAELTLGKKNK